MSAVNALIFDEVFRNVSEVADAFAADGAARLERQSLDKADFDCLAEAGLIRTGLPKNRRRVAQGSPKGRRRACSEQLLNVEYQDCT